MTTTARANPFESLDDFKPTAETKPVPTTAIAQIAEEAGFPSRQARKPVDTVVTPPTVPRAPRRRYVTGRNQQINIKATPETIERLYKIADARRMPLGEVLEQALNALEKSI